MTMARLYLYKLQLLIILFMCSCIGHTQDVQLTQFYASGVYLNPGFTGITGCNRIASSNRIQWPKFSGGYVTNLISFDGRLKDHKNSLGMMVLSDVVGTGRFYSRSVNAFYAHDFTLSRTRAINVGVQSGYTWQGADYSRYLFADQMSRGGTPPSVEMENLGQAGYLDFAFGAVYYSPKVWLGVSAHHLNQPNQSVLGQLSKLPIKASVHGGVKVFERDSKLDEPESLTLAFNYKAQAEFDQFDLAAYYFYNPIVFGIWYRGIPGLKAYQPGYRNDDALALIVGLKRNGFTVGYSYDITISRLTSSTGGAHELTLSYTKCPIRKRMSRAKKIVPCPKF